MLYKILFFLQFADKFGLSLALQRRVVPSSHLFLNQGAIQTTAEPASEQVFRRDQWAPCTHVCASQCDINIAIIIYVLSLHPHGWDVQNKPTRKHPSAILYSRTKPCTKHPVWRCDGARRDASAFQYCTHCRKMLFSSN